MFNTLFFRRIRSNAARATRPFVPRLEGLEDRFCPSGGYLFVDSLNTSSVLRYDETTGAFVDEFVKTNSGGLYESGDMDIGPDHNLYVSNGLFPNHNQAADVLRYDGATGAFLGDFADSGPLTSPRGVIFGPDGNLYVANSPLNDTLGGGILRFDGKTGAFLDEFVHAGSGGLSDPHAMLFGPDGNLYVIAGDTSEVLRYNGRTGSFIDVFVAPGQGGLPSGGLSRPTSMAFGPDGNLYVANSQLTETSGGGILRFDGKTGAFIDTFVAPDSGGLKPLSIVFGPGGDLYVGYADTRIVTADPHTSTVLRFQGPGGPNQGAYLGTLVTAGSGGLRYPSALIFSETDPVTRAYDGGQGDPAATLDSTTLNYEGTTTASINNKLLVDSPIRPRNLSIGNPAIISSAPSSLQPSKTPAGAVGSATVIASADFSMPILTGSPALDDSKQWLWDVETAVVDQFVASLEVDSFALSLDDLALAPRN